MKRKIRNYLMKKGLYEYIRYSAFFSLYTFLFKRKDIYRHRVEVSFYKSFIDKCPLIFDIGGYDGHKTAAFLQIADKVVCCEPDSHNFRTLKIRFRRQRSRVAVRNLAISDHRGEVIFHVHHAGSAFNTLNLKWKEILEDDHMRRWNEQISFSKEEIVSCQTLDDLIAEYGKPQFIKIDVEGHEQLVLKGLSHIIPFISFECLLPDCKEELLQCLEFLYLLNNRVLFNVAYEEALEFKEFVNYHDIVKWVGNARPFCFEMVAKN